MTSWKGIGWNLSCIFEDDDWYRDFAPLLLELLPETFFWDDITHVWDGRFTKRSAASLEKVATSDVRLWKLTSAAKDFPSLALHCHRMGRSLGLKLMVHDDAWSAAGGALAASIEALTWQFIRALRSQARFLTDSGVFPSFFPLLEYEHLEPEPEHRLFRFDLVVDILDRRLVPLLASDGKKPDATTLERVCKTKPPSGVKRVEDGDQIVQIWTKDLHDEDGLRKAARQHERWLDKAIRGK